MSETTMIERQAALREAFQLSQSDLSMLGSALEREAWRHRNDAQACLAQDLTEGVELAQHLQASAERIGERFGLYVTPPPALTAETGVIE